jgi:hypothetical protein
MSKKKGHPKKGAPSTGTGRQPASVITTGAQKKPIPAAPRTESGATIVWRFSMLDLKGPWGWKDFSGAVHATQLSEKATGWESMKEGEFFGPGGNKLIPIGNLCAEAQRRLEELELDDHDGLWELRLSGKPRLWGLRSGHVFYPLWWDPKHTVCPSKKKHT